MAVPGTHVLYGATGGDFIGSGVTGSPLIIQGGVVLLVWDITGVTRVTDLYSQSEDAVTTVTSDDFGNYRFYGPKSSGGPLMVSMTDVSTRYAVFPVEAAAVSATEAIQDTAAAMITGGTHTNITATYNDAAATLSLAGSAATTTETIQDVAAGLLTGVTHTNITATYDDTAGKVTLVGSAGTGGPVASTDLTDSALLLRTTGNALKTTGILTFNAGTVAVAADAFPQTAVTGLVTALAGKATIAALAGTTILVNNIDGSNPPRPNTATTGQVVIWLYQAGNPPALNGTSAGGAYASLNDVDLHLTFA